MNETVRVHAQSPLRPVVSDDTYIETFQSAAYLRGWYPMGTGAQSAGTSITGGSAVLYRAAVNLVPEEVGFSNNGSALASTIAGILDSNEFLGFVGAAIFALGRVLILNKNVYQASDEHVFPSFYFAAAPDKQTDDGGVILPSIHKDVPRVHAKSLGDIVEPYARYLRELNLVMTRLHERRGSDAQEQFMFDVIAPFIDKHGIKVIEDIDLALDALPRSARYAFPYLLGHIRPADVKIQAARHDYLLKYAASADDDIRQGACDALEHLNAA